MDPTTSSHIPRARSKGLLVEHLDDETLVYDLSSHEAHCLNKAAAHVWGMADGEYTVAQIAGTLPDVGLPADESIVAASLGDLTAAELLCRARSAEDVDPYTSPGVAGARPRSRCFAVPDGGFHCGALG